MMAVLTCVGVARNVVVATVDSNTCGYPGAGLLFDQADRVPSDAQSIFPPIAAD